jgi:hypothetical protein
VGQQCVDPAAQTGGNLSAEQYAPKAEHRQERNDQNGIADVAKERSHGGRVPRGGTGGRGRGERRAESGLATVPMDHLTSL